jgi:hypothetical protein
VLHQGHRQLHDFVGDPNISRAYHDHGRTFYAGARFTF